MNIEKIPGDYEKYKIIVPKGIRYLSDWKEFKLFPYPHILNKKIPGCGFTEYCLTNNQDLVLCSPRKILLEDKFKQHKDDIFYVINSYEKVVGIDKEINKNNKSRSVFNVLPTEETLKEKQKKLEYYNSLKRDIESYIWFRYKQHKPFKIIVTYDSFYLVKGILRESNLTSQQYMFDKIQYIIDEMQSVFVDAAFKSSTENNFLVSLRGLNSVCYVSATPMIEEYLRLIDHFENLPYYEFDWKEDDSTRISAPKLKVKKLISVTTTAKDIINKYLEGNFEHRYVRDPSTGEIKNIESKEAVFFMNSVNNILNVIRASNLKPHQVNILCADTPENIKRVRKKLGVNFKIGTVPLKDEPHKMFTFCTRTVYLGADFYSRCARTFILSDANIETLAVDISLDLPQILGRQRLDENPWRNEAEFYYKTICDSKINSQEVFNAHMKHKMEVTSDLLNIFEHGTTTDREKYNLAVKYEIGIYISNYKGDYVSVNTIRVRPGEYIKQPVLNKLLVIAERRAFDIQQIDYANRFSVFQKINGDFNLVNIDNDLVVKFFSVYEKLPTLYHKLKYLCEYPVSEPIKLTLLDQIKEKHFKEYYNVLGPKTLKSLGYDLFRINKKLNILSFDGKDLINDFYNTFKVGYKYTRKEVKQLVSDIYQQNHYNASPKATDIEKYFNIKKVKIRINEEGDRENGFEIVSVK